MTEDPGELFLDRVKRLGCKFKIKRTKHSFEYHLTPSDGAECIAYSFPDAMKFLDIIEADKPVEILHPCGLPRLSEGDSQ